MILLLIPWNGTFFLHLEMKDEDRSILSFRFVFYTSMCGIMLDLTIACLLCVFGLQIINDRETGRSRGFGFVTFSSEQSMRDAIEGMNGQNLDGRNITVNEAQSRGSGGGGSGGGGYRGGGGGGYGGGGRRDGGYNRGGYGSGGGGYGGGGRDRGYGDGGSRYSRGGGASEGNWRN